MAIDQIELARRAFDALASDGVDGMLEFVHPEFEMETPAAIAIEPQTYTGHDGLRRYFESFYEAMDVVVIEPEQVLELDPQSALIHFKVHTRGRSSGIEAAMEARAVATLRDDLLHRLEFILPGDPDPAPAG